MSKSTRLVVGPSKRTCAGSRSPCATPSGPGASSGEIAGRVEVAVQRRGERGGHRGEVVDGRPGAVDLLRERAGGPDRDRGPVQGGGDPGARGHRILGGGAGDGRRGGHARPGPDERRQQRRARRRLEEREPEIGEVGLEAGHEERQGSLPTRPAGAAGARSRPGRRVAPGRRRTPCRTRPASGCGGWPGGATTARTAARSSPGRSARPRRGSPGGRSPGTELVSSGPSISTSSAGSVASTRPGRRGSSGKACRTRRSSRTSSAGRANARRSSRSSRDRPAGPPADSQPPGALHRGEQPPRDEVLRHLARAPASQLQPVLQSGALRGFHERLPGGAGQQLPVVVEHALQARGHRGCVSASVSPGRNRVRAGVRRGSEVATAVGRADGRWGSTR